MSEAARGWWHGDGGGKEVLRTAWPLILGNSFSTLQITLDRILLSRHDGDENGAALAAAMLFWAPFSLLQNTINYVAAFVAQFLGAGRTDRVGAAFAQALWLALAFSLLFLSLYPFAEDLTTWADHDPRQQMMEVEYLRYLCFAAPGFLVLAALTGFFAGLGRSATVLIVNAVGFVLNLALAWVLIFGNLGAPEMGIAGAGIATAVSTSLAAMLGLAIVWKKSYREMYSTLSAWRPEKALLLRLLRYGLPTGVLGVLETTAFTLFLVFVGRLGPVELNATSIATTLNLLVYLPLMGMAQASGVLVSRRLGEDAPDLAARSVRSGLLLGLILTGSIATVYVAAPDLLVEVFRSDEHEAHWGEIAELSRRLLLFVVVYCLFDTANLVLSFSLRGAGDTLFVVAVTLALSVPLMVAPAWAASKGRGDVHTAWMGASAFPIACALVFAVRFRRGKWRSMRIIDKEVV